MMKRDEILDAVMAMLPAQFEETLFRLGIPPQYISAGAPQAMRAIEAVRYLEGRGKLGDLGKLLGADAGPAPRAEGKSSSTTPRNSASKIRFFVEFADGDEAFYTKLAVQLKVLQKLRPLDVWSKALIPAGANKNDEIRRRFVEADVLVVLVSANLLASDESYDLAISALDDKRLRVIPVVVAECAWRQTRLGELAPLPADGVAVNARANRDAAWHEVVEGLRAVIDSLISERDAPKAEPVPRPQGAGAAPPRHAATATGSTILFLGAAPADLKDPGVGREHEAIDTCLLRSAGRDRWRLEEALAVTAGKLIELMLRHRPAIVHFSGHGSKAGQLVLEDQAGKAAPVPTPALARMFAALKELPIRCVFLNACYTEQQARAIVESVDCVIGISGAVGEATATAFSVGFYTALAAGESVATAADLAGVQAGLTQQNNPDALRLLVRPGVSARDIRFP